LHRDTAATTAFDLFRHSRFVGWKTSSLTPNLPQAMDISNHIVMVMDARAPRA
jgi:hypothetical protein